MTSRPKPPDQSARDAAVTERGRNVIIDAGAGTGKTSTLVRRLVNLAAPVDGVAPVPIERIAAVTFTNRAAGELRLRIREELLEALGALKADESRADALRAALAGLDNAAIGTIHSFSDRLLRRKPVEAKLSPEYEIYEDEGELLRETMQILMRVAEGEDLPDELGVAQTDEAAETIREAVGAALAAEIPGEDTEHEFHSGFGLEGLVAGFILNRDVTPAIPARGPLDFERIRRFSAELSGRVDALTPGSVGVKRLKGLAAAIARGIDEGDERGTVAAVIREAGKVPGRKKWRKGNEFGGDADAHDVFCAWCGDERKRRIREGSLREDLVEPAAAWLAARLVALAPLVVQIYERVKARHRALDQVDLLLKLRDLVRDDKDSRAYYQNRFDHVFVDEFQDTDPLQAEIVMFLCEDGAEADRWDEVRLRPGKLTIVGDAKQSIYRFRRADVAMYDRVRRKIEEGEALSCTLSANFRSVRPMIDWLNGRFPAVLGKPPPEGDLFDADTGQVFYQTLDNGRAEAVAESLPAVHRVPFEDPNGIKLKAGECRDLEGRALARYVRWLVDNPEIEVTDRRTGKRRRVRYGDVAVLALATHELKRLFRCFDDDGVPHSVRGGKLFLSDDLHVRFFLGLRAIADREDGTAMATLLRPPFFALDPADLLAARAKDADENDSRVRRVREAEEVVRDLRRFRFTRPAGETARRLLERSALADWVARRPNGAQRLRHLREICSTLELHAAADRVDYDQATRQLRSWATDPGQLDPPLPVGEDAVQVVTVHQAKGLEFPVVILWDGRALAGSPNSRPAWRVSRDGGAWAIGLQGFSYEYPAGTSIAEEEKNYRDHERRRLVYVAATRARDVLVLPGAPGVTPKHVQSWFAGGEEAEVRELEPFVEGREPAWSTREVPASVALEARPPSDLDAKWATAVEASAEGRLRPLAVTTAAKAVSSGDVAAPSGETITIGEEEGDDVRAVERRRARRTGRYGPTFGTTVHVAIGAALADPSTPVTAHVARAASTVGLQDNLDEAAADVERALASTRELLEGLGAGVDVRVEYPVCGVGPGGEMLLGAIDLLVRGKDELHVIDFKTDAPPNGSSVSTTYADQLKIYSELLTAAGVADGCTVRRSLLFTADGSLHDVS